MKLIDALKRLAAMHLKGEMIYKKRSASLHFGATYDDLFNLRVSLATDNTFPYIGRDQTTLISQALVDDPEAFDLFIVSELQRVLDSILELNEGAEQFPFPYWRVWLDLHRTEAETLRKDMNL